MKHPTARQLEVLQAIADFIATNEIPPTFRELAALVGCTATTAVFHDRGYGFIQCLQMKGCLEIHAGRKRGLRITDRGYELLGLPAQRMITPRAANGPAAGTVDLGSRCPDCGVQLFGGFTHCIEHRSAA